MPALAVSALLLALTSPTSPTNPAGEPAEPVVTPFKTDVQPRVDPVFGGVAALRSAIDEFLSLEDDMKKTRDAFSNAVHDALAQVRATPGVGGSGALPGGCPPGAPAAQNKARDAGRRFLALGRRFEARFREIRRGLGVGDTVALTPDYRWKAGRARELYGELRRDYQEMRAAFHDQLEAELRHAGCKGEPAPVRPTPLSREPAGPDPDNAEDWSLAGPEDPLPPLPTAATRPGRAVGAGTGKGPDPETSPAIWIQIDNTRCARPSAFTLDGQPVAPIPAGKKIQIRTRAGPHALRVLPASEKRACGATGTVRRVYLFDGWSMAVRCTK